MKQFHEAIKAYIEIEIETLRKLNVDTINDALNLLLETQKALRQVYIFGNGGSSATASHFKNDFGKGISEFITIQI